MADLSISSKQIRQYDGLYSLNDLHKSAGGEQKYRPNYFLTNQQTKELVAEIQHCRDSGSGNSGILKRINGGHYRGTYACKELVYAYAMWISPKFHLQVIRAFDAMQNAGAIVPALHQRFLVKIEGGKVSPMQPVPDDAYVMTLEQIPMALEETVIIKPELLTKIMGAAFNRLREARPEKLGKVVVEFDKLRELCTVISLMDVIASGTRKQMEHLEGQIGCELFKKGS